MSAVAPEHPGTGARVRWGAPGVCLVHGQTFGRINEGVKSGNVRVDFLPVLVWRSYCD